MRNLGGAIGLALIDTVLEQRTPAHVASIVARLQAGDASAARLVGLPTERFTGAPIGDVDEATRALVAPLVERAGLVAAFNDAWLLLGGLVALSMLVPLVRAPARSGRIHLGLCSKSAPGDLYSLVFRSIRKIRYGQGRTKAHIKNPVTPAKAGAHGRNGSRPSPGGRGRAHRIESSVCI